MNKRTYERASLEVVAFDAKDIITTSNIDHDGNSGTSIVLPDDIF